MKASALNLVHPTSGLDTDQMTHRFGIIHHISLLLHSNLQYLWLFLLGTYLKSYDSVFHKQSLPGYCASLRTARSVNVVVYHISISQCGMMINSISDTIRTHHFER